MFTLFTGNEWFRDLSLARRMMWVEITSIVAFDDKRLYCSVCAKHIDLKRGQMLIRPSHIAKRCRVTRTAVRKFLHHLGATQVLGRCQVSATCHLVYEFVNADLYGVENHAGFTLVPGRCQAGAPNKHIHLAENNSVVNLTKQNSGEKDESDESLPAPSSNNHPPSEPLPEPSESPEGHRPKGSPERSPATDLALAHRDLIINYLGDSAPASLTNALQWDHLLASQITFYRTVVDACAVEGDDPIELLEWAYRTPPRGTWPGWGEVLSVSPRKPGVTLNNATPKLLDQWDAVKYRDRIKTAHSRTGDATQPFGDGSGVIRAPEAHPLMERTQDMLAAQREYKKKCGW